MIRNFIHIINLVVWTFFVLVTNAAYLSAQEKKLLVLTEEWPPYNYTENGTLKGFSVEIVQHIIRDMKRKASIEVFPGMRATKILKINPDAMFISMFRTPEREKEYKWIGPLIDSSIHFYKRKNTALEINTLEDAKTVGVIASRQAGIVRNLLLAKGFSNLDDTARNGWDVYRKLLAGRCDLGISDSPLGVKYILKRLGVPTDALTQTPAKILDAQLYIAANKNISDQEVRLWQKSLDALKASGGYERILEKYN